MTIHYSVAYDRPNTKGSASTIHLGDFLHAMDAQSLLRKCQKDGLLNVRLRSRAIGAYVDVNLNRECDV